MKVGGLGSFGFYSIKSGGTKLWISSPLIYSRAIQPRKSIKLSQFSKIFMHKCTSQRHKIYKWKPILYII